MTFSHSMILLHLSGSAAVVALLGLFAARNRPWSRRAGWLALVLLLSIAGIATAADHASMFGRIRMLDRMLFVYTPLALAGFAWIGRSVPLRVLAGLCAAAILVVGGWAHFVEPYRLEVTHVRVTTAKLDHPVRIAVLADIQTDSPGPFEARVLDRVRRENPDLIVYPGDYVSEHVSRYLGKLRVLNGLLRDADLRPTLGAFAVPGSCERAPHWPEVFEGTGTHVFLASGQQEVGPVTLTGLSLIDSIYLNWRPPPTDRFHVVLGHAPDFSLHDIDADLLIAGHTHGGQVRLPGVGPLMTLSRIPRARAAGVSRLSDGTTLVVSRGIGMERGEAPRLRFLCRPEVVIIDVIPE